MSGCSNIVIIILEVKMVIVYCDKGTGWSPILYMVELSVQLLDAELIVLEYKKIGVLDKLSALLLKRGENKNGEKLLFICPSPTELPLILQIPKIRKRFKFIGVWVIDSFWVDRIPRTIRASNYFDHIFITSEEDVNEWERLTHASVSWLPWGTDALGLGGDNFERQWDLRRVGRQPSEWEDDKVTDRICLDNGIIFKGRPEMFNSSHQNQKSLMNIYKQSKFVLAFSNIANPTGYTHPVRSYLTGRWTDTLAGGGIVAGITPDDPSISKLLWDGATLDLGTIKQNEGIVVLKEALRNWTSENAAFNYKQSLKLLDWRWRLLEIATTFEMRPQKLFDDIKLLKSKIE